MSLTQHYDRTRPLLDPGVPNPSLPTRLPENESKPTSLLSRMGEKLSAGMQDSLAFFKTLGNLRSIIIFNGAMAAVTAPFKIVAIAKKVSTFRQNNREKKIDAGLQICDLIRQIGEGVVTVIVSLERLKKIAYTSKIWARPLAPVLSIFSIAVIANNVRTCMRMRRLLKEIDEAMEKEPTLDGYQKIMKLINQKQKADKDFASDTFNLNIEQLQQALLKTETIICSKFRSQSLGEKEEGKELLQKALIGLRGRVKKNITASMFSVVSSIVSIVGTIVLLLSPLSPVGWVVVGGAIAIDSSSWIHHKVKEYQFAKSVALKRTKLQWITC
jgi:hypothetical protein